MKKEDARWIRSATWWSAAVCVLLVLIFPLGYYALMRDFHDVEMQIEANFNAARINELIQAHPHNWHLQQSKLVDLLTESTVADLTEMQRVLNTQNEVIAQSPEPLNFSGAYVTRSADLLSNGQVVGRLEILADMDAVLWKTVLAGLLGLLLGGMVYVVLRVYPVRNLQRIIDTLFNEKERAEVVLHCIGDAIITTNALGQIEYLNPVAENIVGWNSKEARGLLLSEVLKLQDEQSGQPLPDPVQQAMSEHRHAPLISYALLIKRDGTRIPIQSSVMPIYAKSGWVIGVVLGFHDVSHDRAFGASEAANVAKSQFLANISHEIRTPLNGVLGMLQVVQMGALSVEQQAHVGIAYRSGEALLTLLNELLDFSKIESGHLELEAIDFDLRELVEDVIALQASVGYQKGLNVVCLIGSNVPEHVCGDPIRVRQVLNNLVSNAVKFTERGEVLVQVGILVEAESVLYAGHGSHVNDTAANLQMGSYMLHFSVSDTGIGIATDKLDNIFQPFTQADSSITRKHGGTGLGLAISQRLVEAMGGAIGVTGKACGGSVFSFTARMDYCPPPSVIWQPQQGLVGKRVLIVDDSGSNRMLLEHYFSNWGVQHGSVMDKENALLRLCEAHAAGQPYDVIVLGHQMLPDYGGRALARCLHVEPQFHNVRLIVLSLGVSPKTDTIRPHWWEEETPEHGHIIYTYLTAPVRMRDLHDTLWSVLHTPLGHPAPERPGADKVVVDKSVVDKSSGQNEQSDQNEQSMSHGKRIGSSCKILIVEDNSTNRQVVEGMLDMFGLRTHSVGDGAEALAALAAQHYDLVFMDMMMPLMDGLEATRQWRAQESGRNAEQPEAAHQPIIIAMTANVSEQDRAECLAAGMDDYLTKPMRLDTLKQMLEKWLGKLPEKSPANMPEKSSDQTAAQAEATALATGTVDAEVLTQLRELLGERYEKTVRVFITDTTERINALRDANSQGDREILVRQAHTIKGSGSNFGANELSERCYNLQHQADTLNATEAQQMIEDIAQEFERVKVELVGVEKSANEISTQIIH